jgi:hypothetical protein
MTLSEYFRQAKGVGVLATADAAGRVNQALYARPHFLIEGDDGRCALIMSDRLSHDNLNANPIASYLFIEEGEDYVGRRLSLRAIGEETDQEKIKSLRRRRLTAAADDDGPKFLVHFEIEGVRPLVGAK